MNNQTGDHVFDIILAEAVYYSSLRRFWYPLLFEMPPMKRPAAAASSSKGVCSKPVASPKPKKVMKRPAKAPKGMKIGSAGGDPVERKRTKHDKDISTVDV